MPIGNLHSVDSRIYSVLKFSNYLTSTLPHELTSGIIPIYMGLGAYIIYYTQAYQALRLLVRMLQYSDSIEPECPHRYMRHHCQWCTLPSEA
jgi:hypothetical protein